MRKKTYLCSVIIELQNIENYLLPEDILRFLKLAYFGKSDNLFYLAGKRAYRDFCRTIRNFKNNDTVERQKVRDSVVSLIADEMKAPPSFIKQSEFDEWHTTMCKKIINTFSSQAKLSYGQAQKWLNMTMKYSVVLGNPQTTQLIPFLHAPVDNKVIKIAKEIGVSSQKIRWSKWNKEEYVKYQNNLRDAMSQNDILFIWELKKWEPDDSLGNE